MINSPLDAISPEQSSGVKPEMAEAAEHRKLVAELGGPTSTMDPAYDARRPDESWFCVFCKRGTHVLVSQLHFFKSFKSL